MLSNIIFPYVLIFAGIPFLAGGWLLMITHYSLYNYTQRNYPDTWDKMLPREHLSRYRKRMLYVSSKLNMEEINKTGDKLIISRCGRLILLEKLTAATLLIILASFLFYAIEKVVRAYF